jgi:hypothetical protein
MRRSGLIWSVIALVIVACAGDGGTTTTRPATTVTSVAATGEPYPWVEEQREPVPPGSILPSLDEIEYGTGDVRQVPCPGCGQEVDEGEIESHGQGTLQCDHPVDYIANQLIVLDPDGAFIDFFAGLGEEAEDITPELIVEEGESAYEPPGAYRLFQISMDPIDALVEIAQDPDGEAFEVSPNYLFRPSPKWRGTPGDAKTPANASGQVPNPLFGQGVGVLVVDLFGGAASDPVGGHGEFISHLIERLTGAAPVQRGVQFSSPHENDTWSVVAAINSGVMTGGVGVVNLSIGTYPCAVEFEGETIFSPPDLLLDELTRLRDQFDVSFVAAAGNDAHEPTDPLFYPAGYAGEARTEDFVTSVGALGWSEEDAWYAADFTNIFDFNVWAPGVAVVSEIDGSAYAWSGTSFAAPHVSACRAAGMC